MGAAPCECQHDCESRGIATAEAGEWKEWRGEEPSQIKQIKSRVESNHEWEWEWEWESRSRSGRDEGRSGSGSANTGKKASHPLWLPTKLTSVYFCRRVFFLLSPLVPPSPNKQTNQPKTTTRTNEPKTTTRTNQKTPHHTTRCHYTTRWPRRRPT